MPSVYHSCAIIDEAADAADALKQHFEEIQQDFNDQLAALETSLNDLEGDPVKASVTIGSTIDNQIVWTAQEAGRDGNLISISYVYLGPEIDLTVDPPVLSTRIPASSVDGNTITLYLGVNVLGEIAYDTFTNLFVWLSNPDVTDLVSGELVGTGFDDPDIVTTTPLTGGKDRAMTLTDDAANEVAKVFGYKSYRELLRAVEIPVIETDADVAQYIQDGDEYIVVNGKLLIVDGTNLVAINKLYEVTGNDLAKTKEVLDEMTALPTALPTMVTTQNTSTTTYQVICGESQPVVTVTETFRNVNTNVNTTVATFGGTLDSLHHYIFWGEQVNTAQASYDRLTGWGIPEEYTGEIMSNTDAVQEGYLDVQAPEVFLVDDLSLLTDLQFTNAELEELLALGIDGVKIPHKVPMADRVEAIAGVLKRRPAIDPNGLRNRVKAPIVATQGVDVADVTADQDLSKELATRGSACARTESRLAAANTGYNVPNLAELDLPNLPSAQLPDSAKKIESAFGSLASSISTANRVFDRMIGSLVKTVKRILNKIQDALSLAENLYGNSLAGCLLGTGTAATGMPEFPGVGQGGGSSIPSVSDVLGGLPLPESVLRDALKKLSRELDELVTDAFAAIMQTISIPLCIVQKLLSGLSGFDLGGLTNPCKEGEDADELCPPEEIQATIDASATLTSILATIPHLEDAPTTLPQYDIEEEVTRFTGGVKQTVTETTGTVTRGIQEVMDEISQSINAKVQMIEEFDQAIQELFGDARNTKNNIDETAGRGTSCAPSELGFFTDAIVDYI